MEWYGPLTIMPAIGLMIISTSNFTVALINEIVQLEEDVEKHMEIIELKLVQLRLLSIAISLLYGSILMFLFASLANLFLSMGMVCNALMFIGVLLTTGAIILLLIYSMKATNIRQKHLHL